VLDKVKRQLDVAGRTIESTGARTRALQRKLRTVEELPSDAAAAMLELDEDDRDGRDRVEDLLAPNEDGPS